MAQQTREQASRRMRAIKGKGSKIETLLQKELWSRGLHYRKNVRSVYGTPDIAFIGKQVAIFCDSEFWHGFDWDNRKNNFRNNRDFWIPKIERNMLHDREVTEKLQADGWLVLRYWGDDILKNTVAIADQIEATLRSRNTNKRT